MRLFRRRPRYDRRATLDEATREERRGRPKRAIALYRRVLAVEPGNVELHSRLAPLLAETGQSFDAWLSFRTVARAHMRRKALDQALAVWRRAAAALPDRVETWLAVARLERRLGREQRAVDALLAGRRRLHRRRQRSEAIHLLCEARQVRPWDADLVIDLAELLSASKRRPEAEDLLDALAGRTGGAMRRRVRAVQWRIAPSLSRAWLWLRAA